MEQHEFNENVGRVLGIKSSLVVGAHIKLEKDDHLKQMVILYVVPTKYQTYRLRKLAYEFGHLKHA